MTKLSSITLRPVISEDEEFLFHLYCKTREPEFAFMSVPDPQKTRLLHMQFRAQQGAYRVQYPLSCHELVLQEGTPVGRIWTADMEGEFHLLDIALLPEFRNQGVGTFLLKEIQTQALEIGKPIRSTVFRFNAGSLRFHQRLGFQIAAQDEIQFYMEWTPESAAPGKHNLKSA